MAFQLDQRLAADTVTVGDLPLCRLLLHTDSRFPWCILVPRRPGLTELVDVPDADKPHLWQEIDLLSNTLRSLFSPHKLNVAALGNQVPQLHVHIIGRYRNDAAWPGPVWGRGTPQAYTEAAASSRVAALRRQLGLP
jgi:diadenosine tetraphosphate (Ap4A) HIT family hydrolase